MANGQKGKASKRKLDMREESGKLARQIGDRIRELRERMKDGDGRPITQPAFYDFIFDKPEYQQSTDNPNEPKPEESKQTEISNIEGGKDISLALLCLISDKCGVSLDYLIRNISPVNQPARRKKRTLPPLAPQWNLRRKTPLHPVITIQ